MRRNHTRRALALCLALLLCGLPAVTAGAAEPLARYPDRADIGPAYTRAVEHMTEQNILQGYDDGGFHPGDTLTREQGAKIITYLLLGAEKADALTGGAAPFADVAASRWSAPAIAWCSARHILDGYGNGRFGPADPLTGQQFAKMLLCAYGLGDASGYVGAAWAEKVSAAGDAYDLFAGDETMDSGRPLQRQQAALMADNAQTAGTHTTSGDIHLPEVP